MWDIPRVLMPQITKELAEPLRQWLSSQGITCRLQKVEPFRLVPVQRIDWDRSRLQTLEKVVNQPVWTSDAGYILDGAHRWKWHVQNHSHWMKRFLIPLNFESAMTAITGFLRAK